MRIRKLAAFLALGALTAVSSGAKSSPEQQREKIRKRASETLADLYKLHPASKAAIQSSAGHAVFSNMGVNLLLVSTGNGAGVAVKTNTKQETFMKMVSVGVGLGAGVKSFRAIFVFE